MLSDTLVTHEIRNSAGADVGFQRISENGRSTEYAQVGEPLNLPNHFKIQHREVGGGSDKRRQSNVRFDLAVTGISLKQRNCSLSLTLDVPVGDLDSSTPIDTIMAQMMSGLCLTNTTATTVLLNCTGTLAAALKNGTI